MDEDRIDDGSLSFLRIPPNKDSKSFQCPTTTQSNLVNTSFWVQGFLKMYRKQKLLRKSIKQHFCRKVAVLRRQHGLSDKDFKQVAPWLGWAKYSNSKYLIQKLYINYESIL